MAVVVAAVVFSFVTQRARGQLTAEQLFVVERLHGKSLYMFVPAVPVIICLVTTRLFPEFRVAQFLVAVVAAVLLSLGNAWRYRERALAAGLPLSYVSAMFWGMCILVTGFVVGLVLISLRVAW